MKILYADKIVIDVSRVVNYNCNHVYDTDTSHSATVVSNPATAVIYNRKLFIAHA